MSFTTFKGFSDIGQYSLSEKIKTNLIFYLNWSFIDKGAYYNITRPTSGVYGGDWHRLRRVDDPNYEDGQVWESARNNWVWETGVSQPIQPIRVSGVYVDGTFHAINSDHYVNYADGQIIFDEPINEDSNVQAEYSWRYINIYLSEDIPWFKQVQYRSQRVDNPHFLHTSGDWSQLAQTRVQLPAVAIEVGRRRYAPYQLGGGQYAYTDVIFHIMAEDGNECDRIADFLSMQNDKTIFLIDLDLLAESGKFPLDYRGMIISGALMYPSMVKDQGENGYRWRKMTFFDTEINDGQTINQSLYLKNVTTTTEVVLAEI